MNTDGKKKIGDILVASGKLTEEALKEALREQPDKHRKLGEIIVGNGMADELDVKEALSSGKRKMLGQLLLDKKLITDENLEKALEIQRSSRSRLGEVLVEKGLVSESDVSHAIAEQFEVENFYETIPEEEIDHKALATADAALNIRLCKEHLIIPLTGERIAVVDPLDARKFYLKFGTRKVVMSTPSAVIQAVEVLFMSQHKTIYEQMHAGTEEKRFPVDLLDTLIRTAVSMKASDIHITPGEKECSVQFRVDGDLTQLRTYDTRHHGPLSNVIGVLAYDEPSDDTRFHDAPFEDAYAISSITKISIRVSQVPTPNGPAFVLRLHKKGTVLSRPEQLGFTPEQVLTLNSLSCLAQGMILFVGPTGSGKTTSLYAFAGLLNKRNLSIRAIEDPIEVELPFATQVQVNEKAGITFAGALRAFLRNDPDVIIAGEIRDEETARLATAASITGHVVLSTIHAGDIFSVFTRLHDKFGIGYQELATVVAVVSQRLVKNPCSQCVDEVRSDCGVCGGKGYHGRKVMAEILVINQAMVDALYDNDFHGFRQEAGKYINKVGAPELCGTQAR